MMCRGRRIVIWVVAVLLTLRTKTLWKELCSKYSMALFISSSSSSSYPLLLPPPPLPPLPPPPPPRQVSLPQASERARGLTVPVDDDLVAAYANLAASLSAPFTAAASGSSSADITPRLRWPRCSSTRPSSSSPPPPQLSSSLLSSSFLSGARPRRLCHGHCLPW